MYAAPLEKRAEHEQHHRVCRGGDLLCGGQQRRGQLNARQAEGNTGDRAEDERIFKDVRNEAQRLGALAAEYLECNDRDGVEHRNDDRNQYDDRSRVRARHERRCQRQSDYNEVRAVDALYLHAALACFLFGKQDIGEAEEILDKNAGGGKYEKLWLHGVRQVGGVDVVKQHYRHEIAKQQLIEFGHVRALYSAQMPRKAAERHEHKYGQYRVYAYCESRHFESFR